MLHTCVMYGLFHNLNTFFSAQTLPDCNNSDSLNHPKGGGGHSNPSYTQFSDMQIVSCHKTCPTRSLIGGLHWLCSLCLIKIVNSLNSC